MRILIVGSGGREHSIVWALRKTSSASIDICCAPGNGGIAQSARVFPTAATDLPALVDLVKTENIQLTFVGPEAPLAAGIVDCFTAEGLPVVGPSQAAARLESSKVFAKDFMARNNIPTADYRVASSPREAIDVVRGGVVSGSASPVVIKADGLAAGKGVVVAQSTQEAEKAIEDLMVTHVAGADAAHSVVIEQALVGVEASLLLFADGENYAVMPAARDHKRIGENDSGPNTGGMGSITDPAVLNSNLQEEIVRRIVEPTLAGAEREGFPFHGILFLGLMITSEGPKLLEYNVRFGDPETQAILVRLKTDLLSIFEAIRSRSLNQIKVEWHEGSSACVVLANRGYPGAYESGATIEGLKEVGDEVQVFHAGTSSANDGRLLATGGRVLGVTAAAAGLPEALRRCYSAVEKIHWPGMQFRRDIGRTVLG